MEAQPAIKGLLVKQLIALLVFLIIGFILAAPLLCPGGDVVARYKARLYWRYLADWRGRCTRAHFGSEIIVSIQH